MTELKERTAKPTHPGEVFLSDVLRALGLSVEKAARLLGVHRESLRELVKQQRPLSVEMACRLAKFTNTSVESWCSMQVALDLWEAKRSNVAENVKRYMAESAPETFTAEQIRKACEEELESWGHSDLKHAAKIAVDGVRERLIEEQES